MLREDKVYARGMAGHGRKRPGVVDRKLNNAGEDETYRECISLAYSATSNPCSGSKSNPVTDRRKGSDFANINLRGVRTLAPAVLSHWPAFDMRSAKSLDSSMSYLLLNGRSSVGLP